MADNTYTTGIYFKDGGDTQVVADRGKIEVEAGGIISVIAPPGNVWFVDSAVSASGDGKSWGDAFKTITEAVAAASAYDTIYLRGSFSEAVTCATAGIRFVGVGNAPRQAYWTAPTVAGSFCLKLAAAYCRVENIYFRPVAYTTSGVPSGIQLAGADYAAIVGCRFQGQTGSYKAIYSPAPNSDNVKIIGNEFYYLNTATHGGAIVGVDTEAACYSGWQIVGNVFSSCVTAVDIGGRCCVVRDNLFAIGGLAANGSMSATLCTKCLDLSGTNTGGNMVTGNMFAGEYDTDLYVPATTGDCWVGNTTLIEADEAPYGLTVADPAAED